MSTLPALLFPYGLLTLAVSGGATLALTVLLVATLRGAGRTGAGNSTLALPRAPFTILFIPCVTVVVALSLRTMDDRRDARDAIERLREPLTVVHATRRADGRVTLTLTGAPDTLAVGRRIVPVDHTPIQVTWSVAQLATVDSTFRAAGLRVATTPTR